MRTTTLIALTLAIVAGLLTFLVADAVPSRDVLTGRPLAIGLSLASSRSMATSGRGAESVAAVAVLTAGWEIVPLRRDPSQIASATYSLTFWAKRARGHVTDFGFHLDISPVYQKVSRSVRSTDGFSLSLAVPIGGAYFKVELNLGFHTAAAGIPAAGDPPSTTRAAPRTAGSVPPAETPAPTAAHISFAQAATQLGDGASLATSFPNPVAAGDLLVGLFRTQSGTRVADNLNGPWTQAVNCGVVSIWYAANAKPGLTTVTLGAGSTGQLRASLAEYAGAATASPLDGAACGQGSTAAVTLGSATAASGELAVAGLGTGSYPITVVPGLIGGLAATLRTQTTNAAGTAALEDVTAATAGAQTAAMTMSAAGSWTAVVATFKHAATLVAASRRVQAASTAVPPTATAVPPTATAVPPTGTMVPPTATAVPPTATVVPPTATVVPPTATVSTGADPSGQAMPVGDLPGWHQIFTDDFATDVPVGSFPGSVYGSKWAVYPDGQKDTSGNGEYYPSRVLSVSNGVLNMYLHTENGIHMVAAPRPIIIPGQPNQGQLYGRYTVRFRADSLAGYKTAWLLWPDWNNWPANGEIDFPEADLNGSITAFMHWQNGTAWNSYDTYHTNTSYSAWHTATIEWAPNAMTFYLDGQVIGQSTSRIPDTPMHWVLQTETSTYGVVPNDATAGNVQIAWVAVYSYQP